MMGAVLLERVKTRLGDEAYVDAQLAETVRTVSERVNLRAGVPYSEPWDTPLALSSIVVDAAVKMHRRVCFEGISSEGTEAMSTSFVDDILAEYDAEIAAYKAEQSGRVRFI